MKIYRAKAAEQPADLSREDLALWEQAEYLRLCIVIAREMFLDDAAADAQAERDADTSGVH